MTTATKHAGMYQPPIGSPCWHTVADAAKALGKSESAVRRAAKKAGIVRISGRAQAGMVELRNEGADWCSSAGYLPYFE